ncbi:MAG: chemotaxis protein CheC, partial [Anaerovoracaceae bacterium]
MSDNNEIFSPMEIDGIGEIFNISLGSSATAMSDMLGRKVVITTPNVKIRDYDDFELSEVEPAVGVEITYVTGLEGNNLMLFKKDDVRKILEILMYTEI